jgi:hypothetical protein
VEQNEREPISEQEVFWSQVRLNVTSWMIVCGVAGIGYIGYTVPRTLDLIVRNQEMYRMQQSEMSTQLRSHEVRITRIETKLP